MAHCDTITLELKFPTTEYWRCTNARHAPIIIPVETTEPMSVTRLDTFVCPWCAVLDTSDVPDEVSAAVAALRAEIADMRNTVEDTSEIDVSFDADGVYSALREVAQTLSDLQTQVDDLASDVRSDDTASVDADKYTRSLNDHLDTLEAQIDDLHSYYVKLEPGSSDGSR